MTRVEFIHYVDDWVNKVSEAAKFYDIAIFKIWVKFEKYLADLFVKYCIDEASEIGFKPLLKIKFEDEEHLCAFLREGERTYVEYNKKIEKLSKHIFEKSPFDLIFNDNNNKQVYLQIVSIRNYIAHESSESKKKYINICFAGDANRFLEPDDFLKKKKTNESITNFSYYIQTIKNMSLFVLDPTDYL